MRRVLPWVGAFLVAILAGGGAVVGLNATVFGPGDFVRVYLDAVARGDAGSALALPGVDAAGANPALLTDDVLTGVSEVRQLSDIDLGGTRHRVTMSWATPDGTGTTVFEVQRVGTRFGLFPEWGFATSPVATLTLDVQHDPRFTANDVHATTGRVEAGVAQFAVLVPGSYTLGHDSRFLRTSAVTVLADEVGESIDVTLDIQPGPAFAPALADAVAANLATCATQQVLFPTGCPFGKTITNRIVSKPTWSIVHLPEFEVEPGAFGTWIAGPAPGTAHLTVEVQSLFDGKVSTLDEDVPFQARYAVTVGDDVLRVTTTDVD